MTLSRDRFSPARMFATSVALAVLVASSSAAMAQIPVPRGGFQNALGVQSRIAEQRVQRQTEIMRLETMVEQLGTRVMRLERQLLSNTRFPAITVREAEAALELAEARRNARQSETPDNASTRERLASEQLAVVQAQGQLTIAKAAHAETVLLLELDLIQAERQFTGESLQREQLQRLVAKGYTSSSVLVQRNLDVEAARKRFELARLRLETQQQFSSDDRPSNTRPRSVNATNKNGTSEVSPRDGE